MLPSRLYEWTAIAEPVQQIKVRKEIFDIPRPIQSTNSTSVGQMLPSRQYDWTAVAEPAERIRVRRPSFHIKSATEPINQLNVRKTCFVIKNAWLDGRRRTRQTNQGLWNKLRDQNCITRRPPRPNQSNESRSLRQAASPKLYDWTAAATGLVKRIKDHKTNLVIKAV